MLLVQIRGFSHPHIPPPEKNQETKDVACAFKPNAAFFEAYGSAGWEALQRTLQLIPKEIPLLGL